ncbi:LamG domain-containing protein [Nostoc sp. UHCC 0252]|uniref:LamG domain-containing protein n=1 Tax=Nostoc sp. UHCC 0252 TaxID=3110241 RepID=UPI002B21CC72|nr:LamG domain-containing protein [Nostoc sp. UHCC 0252]MEA5601072.1 LamG domain-containing protein [Nostoc sp. UHCC 0252]
MLKQIKDIGITKTSAENGDFLLLQNPSTSETYKITKENLLAGLLSDTTVVQPTTLLLLHGEGTNGGTSIIDSSSFGRTATRGGNPVTSTTQKKLETSSLYFDGASFLTFPASSDFDLKQNDFAVQAWIYPTSVSGSRAILDRYNSTIPFSWQFALNNGKLNFYIRNSSASGALLSLDGDTTLAINTWYHVGVKRINGVISLWLNEELDAISLVNARLNSSLVLTVGKQGNVSNFYYQGYLDELLFTKNGETLI